MAINELKNGNHLRKALLVVSGGDEYNSHYSQAEIINAADDAHVPIYSVVIFDSQANPSAPAEATAADLEALADITGGRYLTGSLSDPSLALTVARFGIELRNAYVLAYRPKNATGAVRLHVVKVDVTPIRGLPPLEAKFQPQYYYASSQ
jgi:hypothetical protein